MMFYIGCLVVGFIIIYIIFSPRSKLAKLPAPKGHPLFGNMLQLASKKAHLAVHEWSKEFPEGLMWLRLGFQDILVVNGYELIHKVLIRDGKEYANRAQTFRTGVSSGGFKNISFMSYSRNYRLSKKILLGHIKAYGTGLKNIENIINEATSEMIQEIAEREGRPCNLHEILQDSVMDMINILSFDERSTASERQDIKDIINEGFTLFASGGIGELFDRIQLLQTFALPFWKDVTIYLQRKDRLWNSWLKNYHENNQSENDNNLMTKLFKQKQEGIDDNNVQQIMLNDTFLAGVATSSSTLSTLINVLIHHPEIQQKLYDEVCKVKGSITLDDQHSMHYHQAAILETLRYSSIVPFSLAHENCQETVLAGYTIPKGTQIWVNLWTLHHDEDFWEKPYDFLPERYLDSNGDLVAADHPNRTHTLPFGAGVRVCAGEVFARSRLFLMLSNIIKNFEILPETTLNKQPSCDCRDIREGLPMFPPRYKARLVARQKKY